MKRGRSRSQENERYYWFEQRALPPRGDIGLYDVHHREIAHILGTLKHKPLQERFEDIPKLRSSLAAILSILELYHLDAKTDIRRTLRDINEWLPGHHLGYPRRKVY